MIDDKFIPDAFSRINANDENERYRAELPNYDTHWETDDTYVVSIAKGDPDWVVSLYDPDTLQSCGETQHIARPDAERMAIGLMVQLQEDAA